MPTTTGKVFIANETHRKYRFTGLQFDWPAEGFSLSVRITDPNGLKEWVLLEEVDGEGEEAFSDVNTIIYDRDGKHILKLVVHDLADADDLDDRTKWKLASDDYPVNVKL